MVPRVWPVFLEGAGGAVIAVALHELTHLAVARIAGPIDVSVHSYVPFRLRVDHVTESLTIRRAVGIAPTLVGGVVALVVVGTGLWEQLQATGPYYRPLFVTMWWALYTFPSPTDCLLVVSPPLAEVRAEEGLRAVVRHVRE